MSRRKRSRGRPVDGVFLLDKPQGISSNRALQVVKRLFNAAKAGHTGSLDPLATGVLPVCLGEATKFSSWLLDADKSYEACFVLGASSTTGDAEGDIEPDGNVPALGDAYIQDILAGFMGEISQVPPMYSALKHEGQPLYKLARQGLEIKRDARQITIYQLDLISFSENTITISTRCSKGTYIRTLVEDIARAMGCGAYLQSLRRTAAGSFDISQCHTIDELEALVAQGGLDAADALLLPPDCMLESWPEVSLGEDAAYYIQQGQAVHTPGLPAEGMVRMRDLTGRFLGVGEVEFDGRLSPRRLVAQKNP